MFFFCYKFRENGKTCLRKTIINFRQKYGFFFVVLVRENYKKNGLKIICFSIENYYWQVHVDILNIKYTYMYNIYFISTIQNRTYKITEN